VKSPVRFEDEADAEYREAGRWYEARRTGLGMEFFDAVDAAPELIVRMPHAGAPVPRLPPDLPVRRAPVKRFPYHVIYLETHTTIRVLAVAHDRRRPGYWRTRL
jgi:plasmid stabilization system protein ParE